MLEVGVIWKFLYPHVWLWMLVVSWRLSFHVGLFVLVAQGFSRMAAAKSLQLCPTLCDPRDGSPPDSPVPGILQARALEWVAISFSNA